MRPILPGRGAADPDEAVIGKTIADQMLEKVKDVFGAGEIPGEAGPAQRG